MSRFGLCVPFGGVGSVRDDVNVLGLNFGEDLVALVVVGFRLSMIGLQGAELQSARHIQREVVHRAFEDFHGDACREGIWTTGILAVEEDFFGAQGEEHFIADAGIEVANT